MTDETIISTKDQVGEYDAIETLKPGEPVFPLQGGDPFAPACIERWVELCRDAARAEENPDKRRALLEKALSAEYVLWACLAYQRGEEINEVGRGLVNEVAADDARRWRPPLILATRALREAAYQFTEATEHLPDEMAAAVRARVETVNAIADEYQPKRASYGREPELPLA